MIMLKKLNKYEPHDRLFTLLHSVILFFKRWNWGAYFILLFTCMIGAMMNENCKTLTESFILGLIGGNLFGLVTAWVTGD